MQNHVFSLLQAESYRQYDPNGNRMVAYFADAPLGHLTNDAYGFTVKAFVTSAANDSDVAHLAVGSHNETAQHAALDAVLVGMIRILARLVDEVDESSLAAGELWLDVNIVKLIDFDIRLFRSRINGRDVTHLRYYG